MPETASYLDPVAIAKIAGLQLRARVVVEGFVSGLHASHYKGHSLEFAQHREYVPGDELKHIDWKVYGRSDRFFIKQFEEETNLRAYLVLDASGSMAYKGSRSALSKYDYGATLAASLAYLTLKQGDSVGLSQFSDKMARLIPPRNSLAHLHVLLDQMGALKPEGETALAQSLEGLAHAVKKRSLFIVISDLFDDTEAVLKAARFLNFKKNEMIVVQVLDPDEKEFPFSGLTRFDSLETGETVSLEADSFRDDYRLAVNHFIDHYKLAFRNCGVRYRCHATDEPFDRVLRSVLSPI